MKRRKDPQGYPGDEKINKKFDELKEIICEERGLSKMELDKMMREGYERAVKEWAPIRRAIGLAFRAMREVRGMTRLELANQSNVPAREIGRIERGASDFCIGDMMRLCAVLKYPMETLMEDVNTAMKDAKNPTGEML